MTLRIQPKASKYWLSGYVWKALRPSRIRRDTTPYSLGI
jgi:hypothetical protein